MSSKKRKKSGHSPAKTAGKPQAVPAASESRDGQLLRPEPAGNGKRTVRMQTTTYCAPIPPPDIAAGYEQILPGATNRILIMAEQQGSHRRAMEDKMVSSSCDTKKLGLWLAFGITLAAFATMAFAIDRGYPYVGSILGMFALSSLVGSFIYGSKRTARQVEQAEAGQKANRPAKPPTQKATAE